MGEQGAVCAFCSPRSSSGKYNPARLIQTCPNFWADTLPTINNATSHTLLFCAHCSVPLSWQAAGFYLDELEAVSSRYCLPHEPWRLIESTSVRAADELQGTKDEEDIKKLLIPHSLLTTAFIQFPRPRAAPFLLHILVPLGLCSSAAGVAHGGRGVNPQAQHSADTAGFQNSTVAN